MSLRHAAYYLLENIEIDEIYRRDARYAEATPALPHMLTKMLLRCSRFIINTFRRQIFIIFHFRRLFSRCHACFRHAAAADFAFDIATSMMSRRHSPIISFTPFSALRATPRSAMRYALSYMMPPVMLPYHADIDVVARCAYQRR